MMHVPRIVGVMSLVAGGFALLLLPITVQAADASKASDRPCIQWSVKPGIKVSRSRAERLYKSSFKWVETNFVAEGSPTRPCVTIKVGDACPTDKAENCVSTHKKVIYLKKWDAQATVSLTESFLLIGIYDKFLHGGGVEAARKIATDDLKQFVDVSELRKK